MTRDASKLFEPFTAPCGVLPNRLVMAPMTRSRSPGGVPGDDVAEHYRRRAAGGVGLIVTEGTVVDHAAASSDPAVPRFHGADALAGWQRVADVVHGEGSRIIPQLWHVGATRRVGRPPNPDVPGYSPSGLSLKGKPACHEMSEPEIGEVVAAFASAAADAKRLGFDGVEIHGAHSYLIDQFFAADTNLRSDRYGGDLVERTRFAAEIIGAVRAAVGPEFMIVLRMSQWKQQNFDAKLATTPAELERWLEPLSAAGVDVYHASTRRFWEPEFEGSDLNLAGWIKKLSGKPTITVGSVGLDGEFTASMAGAEAKATGIDGLLERLEREEFDLVAVGRALIVDPDWPEKVRQGRLDEIQDFKPMHLAQYP